MQGNGMRMFCRAETGSAAEHVTEEVLRQLKNGTLSGAQKAEALAHIGCCSRCSDAFARCYEGAELHPPLDFQASVYKKINTLHVTVLPILQESAKTRQLGPRKKKDKKMELRNYALKVAAAACATLLLFGSACMNAEKGIPGSAHDWITIENANVISDVMDGISGFMTKWEGFLDDKTEK